MAKIIDSDVFYKQLERIRIDYLAEDSLSSDFAAKVIELIMDEYLQNQPAIDPVKKEKWENTSGYDEWFCSGCGYTVNCDEYPTEIEGYQYCGKCGAKMKEEQK